MRRDTIMAVLFIVAICMLGLGCIIAFTVIPGGATAEEVIRDSIRIKTLSQWLVIGGGVVGYLLYKLDKEGWLD